MTRTLCPLCDWHHDTPTTLGGPADNAAAVEVVLKAHLETHELIEWVRAVTMLRTELDSIEETTVLPALREAGKADRLCATLEQVLRSFVHYTHPGEPSVQSHHVPLARVQAWRAVLNPPKETPDA